MTSRRAPRRAFSPFALASGMTGLALTAALLLLGPVACKKPVPVVEGRELFGSVCARCHSSDGSGGLAATDGGPAPRNFRDHAFQSERTDEQLKQAIVNGKGTAMPPFGAAFSEPQLRSLVQHVRSFDVTTAPAK